MRQKERLNALLQFASVESQRLDKLIGDAQVDGDTHKEQLQKLLESKASTERILVESTKQQQELESKVKDVQNERDAAQAEGKSLVVERDRLQDLVASTRKENVRMESVVAEVASRNAELKAIAEEKGRIEQQFNEVQRASRTLRAKSSKIERLEELVRQGEAEKERLERLVVEDAKTSAEILKEKADLESAVFKVTKESQRLQAELQQRELVDRTMEKLKDEATQLQERAKASVKEKRELEERMEKLCQENQTLQAELQDAVRRHVDLERDDAARHDEHLREIVRADKERALLQQQLHEVRVIAAESDSRREDAHRDHDALRTQLEEPREIVSSAGTSEGVRSSERKGTQHFDLVDASEKAIQFDLVDSDDDSGEQHANATRRVPEDECSSISSTPDGHPVGSPSSERCSTFRLTDQLTEVLKHNETLQQQIDTALKNKALLDEEQPANVDSLLDDWLADLENVNNEPVPVGLAPSKDAAPQASMPIDHLFGSSLVAESAFVIWDPVGGAPMQAARKVDASVPSEPQEDTSEGGLLSALGMSGWM